MGASASSAFPCLKKQELDYLPVHRVSWVLWDVSGERSVATQWGAHRKTPAQSFVYNCIVFLYFLSDLDYKDRAVSFSFLHDNLPHRHEFGAYMVQEPLDEFEVGGPDLKASYYVQTRGMFPSVVIMRIPNNVDNFWRGWGSEKFRLPSGWRVLHGIPSDRAHRMMNLAPSTSDVIFVHEPGHQTAIV